MKNLKELWFSSDPGKQDFCTILRILSHIFLKKNGFLSIFFSNKFNQNSKLVHYKGLRILIDLLEKQDSDFSQVPDIDIS